MIDAFRDGLGRVRRAPALVAGLWLSTLGLAMGPALVLHALIEDHLGSSLMADSAAAGVNFDWWNEFLAQATASGRRSCPPSSGFAAVLDNLSRLADRKALTPVLGALVGAQLLLSLFLSGGLLDRLARDRVVGAGAFFSACGVWFWRFLRLAAIAAPIYASSSAPCTPGCSTAGTWTGRATSRWSDRRLRCGLRSTPSSPRWCAGSNVLFDYAKIRAVVEDRRSMLGALAAGAPFRGAASRRRR